MKEKGEEQTKEETIDKMMKIMTEDHEETLDKVIFLKLYQILIKELRMMNIEEEKDKEEEMVKNNKEELANMNTTKNILTEIQTIIEKNLVNKTEKTELQKEIDIQVTKNIDYLR